jgi:hypothetical protein
LVCLSSFGLLNSCGNEPCVSNWQRCQVPTVLWPDVVWNTIETAVLRRQALAVCMHLYVLYLYYLCSFLYVSGADSWVLSDFLNLQNCNQSVKFLFGFAVGRPLDKALHSMNAGDLADQALRQIDRAQWAEQDCASKDPCLVNVSDKYYSRTLINNPSIWGPTLLQGG